MTPARDNGRGADSRSLAMANWRYRAAWAALNVLSVRATCAGTSLARLSPVRTVYRPISTVSQNDAGPAANRPGLSTALGCLGILSAEL